MAGTSSSNEKKEILIEGRLYDITNFAKRGVHPGGNVINFYVGETKSTSNKSATVRVDASHAFSEFHYRSTKARKWLATLPSRPYDGPSETNELFSDFAKLRKELENEGFFEPAYLHVVYRLVELLILHLVGLWLMTSGWGVIGSALFGFAVGRDGWVMHEGGHSSLTGNWKIDHHIQAMVLGLGPGMSGSFWNNQHNKHHASPQKLRHDVDLNTLPLVAFNTATLNSKIPRSNRWIRWQAYLFIPFVTSLVALFWALFSHPWHSIRTRNKLEIFWLGCRWAYVVKYFNWWMFAIQAWVGGAYLFINFAVSHTHKPIVPADQHLNWIEYSANHTTNIRSFWFTDWWMGYLNYQIEHHLFPAMPQFRQKEISPRVQKLLEKHGFQYDVCGYFEALGKTFKNLDTVGRAAGAAPAAQ